MLSSISSATYFNEYNIIIWYNAIIIRIIILFIIMLVIYNNNIRKLILFWIIR